jgi:hypothetical protein
VTSESGALGRPGNEGVKASVADAAPLPTEFTADTRNTYCVKFVRLFTVADAVVDTPSLTVDHDDPLEVENSMM